MSCVPALKKRFNRNALVKAIHADHAAAALHMFLLVECSYGSDEFVGQRNGEESDICASWAFYLEFVLQNLLSFLRTQQFLQAQHAQLMPAI